MLGNGGTLTWLSHFMPTDFCIIDKPWLATGYQHTHPIAKAKWVKRFGDNAYNAGTFISINLMRSNSGGDDGRAQARQLGQLS